jgi:hypothetical protein
MKKVQPKVIFPCNFYKKHYVGYMAWYQGGIFLRTENPDNIVIFYLLQSPLFVKEFTSLSGYSWSIFSEQQSFKNKDKVVENFIKMQGSFVPS